MIRFVLFVLLVAMLFVAWSTSAAERDTTFVLPGGATMEMVWIPTGKFIMGTTEKQEQLLRDKGMWDDWFKWEQPAHSVTITRGFYLGKYELTQRQWLSVMGTRSWAGEPYVRDNPNYPAVYISWNEVQEFIGRLNRAEGSAVYRLPTEAEWEYACRAGTTTPWSFGDNEEQLGRYAWCYDIVFREELYACRVGMKLPNPWGLYDMHGNVWEWVQGWFGSYRSGAQTDPTGPSVGSGRVIRSGFSCLAQNLRSAYRIDVLPGDCGDRLGARLARLPVGE